MRKIQFTQKALSTTTAASKFREFSLRTALKWNLQSRWNPADSRLP